MLMLKLSLSFYYFNFFPIFHSSSTIKFNLQAVATSKRILYPVFGLSFLNFLPKVIVADV